MTTPEKLEKIAAECRELLACAESNVTDFYGGCAIAGWRSTLAAIEYIGNDAEIFPANTPRGAAARSQLDQILAAWPDEPTIK
jgi:hypothetical protein